MLLHPILQESFDPFCLIVSQAGTILTVKTISHLI